MKRLAFVLMLAAFALTAGCTPTQDRGESAPAPDFTVKDLKGQTLSLSDCKGKVLVLNFWATWCPPCREEIPDFIETYKALKGQGLEILGLSVDRIPQEKLREWTEDMGINYPIAMATRQIVEAYQPGGYIPATIIVDRKGRIRFRNAGPIDKETLARLFKEFSD
jgi:cytochrome c biogenesis protein CcmG/thiol:disulfide interchange protein DsbE